MTTRPTMLITDGPAITWTNYWGSERARAGHLCLAYVEATLQMLLPPPSEHVLEQLPPIGTPVEIWDDVVEGQPMYRLLWFDTPVRPYQVLVDESHWFGYYPRVDAGRTVPLVWYTQVGEEWVLERRREQIQLGRAS